MEGIIDANYMHAKEFVKTLKKKIGEYLDLYLLFSKT